MKSILHATDSAPMTEALQEFSHLLGMSMNFMHAGTLEEAIRALQGKQYHALVYDNRFPIGDITNTGELGTYPIDLGLREHYVLRDRNTGKEIHRWGISDGASGFVLTWLSRMPRAFGGLEHRGGLMNFTATPLSEARKMYMYLSMDITSPDDYSGFFDIMFSPKVGYMNTDYLMSSIQKVADFYWQAPYPGYMAGTIFSPH